MISLIFLISTLVRAGTASPTSQCIRGADGICAGQDSSTLLQGRLNLRDELDEKRGEESQEADKEKLALEEEEDEEEKEDQAATAEPCSHRDTVLSRKGCHPVNVLSLQNRGVHNHACTAQTSSEYCFGFSGSGCEGTPLPPGRGCRNGEQAVSVGSLAHDTCCRFCREGVACSDEAVRHFGVYESAVELIPTIHPMVDNVACGFEWRKAVMNTIDTRYWCVPRDENQVSDLSNVAPAQFKEYVVTRYIGLHAPFLNARRSIPIVQATRNLCAPRGTALDCVLCAECNGNCASGLGDSQFCCTGRFQRVRKRFKILKRRSVGSSDVVPTGTCS